MDIALWALNDGRPAAELAAALDITEAQAQRVYDDIKAKRRTTRYLHSKALLVEPVREIC
jgi:NAD+ synthase